MAILTVAVFCKMLGKLWVKSDQGLSKAAPAGSSRPGVSLKICSNAKQSPPPAESPASTMDLGSTGRCGAPGGGLIR